MSYRALAIEVMIASPGDVPEERNIIKSILLGWNEANGRSNKLLLQPVMWETNSSPDLAGRPQQIINDRLLKHCDLLVGVFWTRLGTPTGKHASGTVEEIKTHLNNGRPAMVYFSSRPVIPGSYKEEQYNELLEFKSWCMGQGLVGEFENTAEFSEKFRSDLSNILRDNPYLQGIAAVEVTETESSDEGLRTIQLSPLALKLLNNAAQGNGHIMVLKAMNGTSFSAGNTDFPHDGSRRSIAELEAAVQSLADFGLIQDLGYKGEIFEVTHEGFESIERNKELFEKIENRLDGAPL